MARLISGGGGAVWEPGLAAPQYTHAGLPICSGAPQFGHRVSWLGIGGEHHAGRRYCLGPRVADDSGPDREELDDVAAPAVVPLLHLDGYHTSGSELSAFGLHPPHRELSSCIGSLREGNVLGAPAKLTQPLTEALG